ncbi:hypothetical protein Tco_1147086 [Tanacetum coccineum]
MNPQETQQVVARDEKWVPFTERVKISSTNVRLETTVPQKEETFQVVIDLVKNSSCFKAFTISADVQKIFMQQFWYSIKKVQGTDSYEFLLANKKCVVNADVFRTILDICPRVEGANFTDVPDDDTTHAFLIKLGYKERMSTIQSSFRKIMHTRLITGRRRDQGAKTCHSPDSPRLKFVRIGEDYQEYGLSILETMMTEVIKQSESYQMFIKYSTGQIPLKKSRGKESEPEPEPVKRKTSSKRGVKKKVTLSADDNIISDDPYTTLELDKSINQTEAKEAEAARQVHVIHARIVIESVPKPTKRRKSGKVTSDPPKKLKGVPSLTLEEQEAADIMQALKESKKSSKRQPGTRGSSEGTGTIPGVPDESTVVSATLSEGNEQESEHSEEDKLDDEEKDDKEYDVDDEDDETESDDDDIYKYKIRMRKDEDEEIINAEVNDSVKGDEEVTDAAKADAEKTSEVKDDAKKTEIPPTSSSLSVSSGFGDQFLKLSSDSSLVSTVKDTTKTEINSLLEVKIQSEVSHTQSPSMLSISVSVISEPTVPTPIQESPSIVTATTLPPPSISTTPFVPQQTTTLIPTPPIITNAPISATTVSESDALSVTQVPSVVDYYLGSKVGDVFQKELKKHIVGLIQKYSLQQIPELPKKQTPTADLEQRSEKSALEILKIKREQAEKQ